MPLGLSDLQCLALRRSCDNLHRRRAIGELVQQESGFYHSYFSRVAQRIGELKVEGIQAVVTARQHHPAYASSSAPPLDGCFHHI